MVERVNTGGMVSFDYSKGKKKRLSHDKRKDIAKGYEKYYERRKIEKRRKIFIIILVVVVVAAGLLATFL